MAIYHLHATPIQRSRGHSAVAAAAYRAGEQLHDRKEGMTHDYSRKRGIVQSEILAPDHAPAWVKDREELWNRAERAEKRRDGQPAREVRVALPSELTDEQRAELVFQFCRDAFVKQGMIADVSIHRPDRHGDERNHHAHILLTMRELDGGEFATRKQRDWNQEETLHGWRELWAEYQNRALEAAGHSARVDHRTLEAQGIDREPTTHMGKEAAAMERRGEQSDRGDRKREIEAKNQALAQLRQERAEVDALIEAEQAASSPVQEPEPAATPIDQTDRPAPSWDEQKAAAQSVFDRSSLAQPEQVPQGEQPSLRWEEQKAAAQSAFHCSVVKNYSDIIKQAGEVKEYGLGKSWYDRTIAFFENLYYNTIRYVKTGMQKYVGRYFSAQDRDVELDRDE